MLSDPSAGIANANATRGLPAEQHGPSCGASITLPELAQLVGTTSPDSTALPDVRFALRHVMQGQCLVRNGDPFRSMYAVRRGAFKQIGVSSGGAEQVLAFPMAGDVIGTEGIDTGAHQADVTALNDAEVAILPFTQLDRLGQELPGVGRLVCRICGSELSRAIENIWMLGVLGATARIAMFLLRLSERLGQGDAPRLAFDLPMTRAEIASFAGVSHETVTRALGSIAAAKLIKVRNRTIRIRDYAGLRAVAYCEDAKPPPRQTNAHSQRVSFAA